MLLIKQNESKRKKKQNNMKMKYSKIVITSLLVTVLVFTLAMTVIFCYKDSVPDSLIAAFFAFAGGEAGILGLIKHGETKYPSSISVDEECIE